MIKIVKSMLPKKVIIITERVRNENKNEIVIECDTRKIFINGWQHSQLFYNDGESLETYAKRMFQRINTKQIKIFKE